MSTVAIMSNVALDLIDENGHNIRRTPATAEQDDQLEMSIRSLGILQPVLLRRADERSDRFFVVAGHRRVRCARLAGLDDIPAVLMDGAPAFLAASQAAENMVRVPMDPVDQWRAIVSLQEVGYTLLSAAEALGISERRAKRLDKLGHIAPEILDLMIGRPLPDQEDLAAIASAPVERQRQVLVETAHRRDEDRVELIARGCVSTRIARSLAIFDVDSAGVPFEEDLFAEPDSDEQFTTDDVQGFMDAQNNALTEEVNRRKKKGERISLVDWTNGALKLPKGWQPCYGEIKKRYPANGRAWLFVGVVDCGSDRGNVKRVAAVDTKAAAKPAPPADVGDGDDDRDEDAVAAATPAQPATPHEAEPSGPALTKRGQTLLAAMKTHALRDRLDVSDGGYFPLSTLCCALLVALDGDNVSIRGSALKFSTTRFTDITREIVSPSGTFMALDEAELARLMAMAISRILRVTDPVTNHGSGVVAEWIGAAIGADANLPRFDTVEFLGCMGGDALSALAVQQGRGGLKTVKGSREALAGSLPDWRPTAFGAPGPGVPMRTNQHDDETGTEEAA